MKCGMRQLAGALAMVFCSGLAAQPVSAPITLQGAGPYHQLTLPAAIYGHAAYADLRDLRITNGAGLAVPFAWLQTPPTEQRITSYNVPLFAWPVAGEGNGAGSGSTSEYAVLAFTVRPDGSLAVVKPIAVKDVAVGDYLLDASQLNGRLLQARVTVAPGTQGFFPFVLQASDDLRRWQPVGAEDQLVVLQQGGQAIERLTVDLRGVQARFLRLHWLDPMHAAQLSAVGIDTVHSSEPVAPLAWSGPLAAERCGADYCDYVLPRGIPANSLRVHLAQANTLATMHVSGVLDAPPVGNPSPMVVHNPLYALRRLHRQTVRPPLPQEVPLLDTVVYRLTQPGGEAQSPDLALNGAVYPRLRLRTDGPVALLGSPAPTLEVSTPLRALVFLAQGQAPFSVIWGVADSTPPVRTTVAAGGPLPLRTLIPGYTPGKAVLADPASVVLAAAATQPPSVAVDGAKVAPVDPRKPWLWSALLLGLLLLAGMAWSLFQSIQKTPNQPADPK
jgi:hypothetical protein